MSQTEGIDFLRILKEEEEDTVDNHHPYTIEIGESEIFAYISAPRHDISNPIGPLDCLE